MASEKVKELTDETFDAEIKSGVTLVDYWAPWCGPCVAQAPILDSVAENIGDKATIAKVNVDDSQAVASRYGIRSIPTLILFKDGQPVQQFVGVQNEESLVEAIDSVG